MRWLLSGGLVAAVAAPLWAWRFSGPHLTSQLGYTGPELANVYLGEYYLYLDEMRVVDLSTGETILRASAARDGRSSNVPNSIPIRAGSDLRPALQTLGWAVSSPDVGAVTLESGGRYRIEVRGNNEFGFSNSTSRVVIAGTEVGPS